MSSPSTDPARWERLRQATAIKTAIFELLRVRFRHHARAVERDFVVIDAPDWVNVVAVTPDERLVLVNQFRYGTNDFSLEIPGGVIERGEDPLLAGQRELQEETGYVGTSATVLGWVHPNPAFQSNRSHFVLVENATKSAALAWDPDEELHVTTERVEDVFTMIGERKITHGLVLNALMFFAGYRRAARR